MSDMLVSMMRMFSPEFWSQDMKSSFDDQPRCLMMGLRFLVATAKVELDMGPPDGCTQRISSLSSLIAFSVMPFLLMFLEWPMSRVRSTDFR